MSNRGFDFLDNLPDVAHLTGYNSIIKHRWLGTDAGDGTVYDTLGGVLGAANAAPSTFSDGTASSGVTFGEISIMPGDTTTSCVFDGTANGKISGPIIDSSDSMPSLSSLIIRVGGLDYFPAGESDGQHITLWERYSDSTPVPHGIRAQAFWVAGDSLWYLKFAVYGSNGGATVCERVFYSVVGFASGTTHWEMSYNKDDGEVFFYANGEYLGFQLDELNWGSVSTISPSSTTPWSIGAANDGSNPVVDNHTMQWRDLWYSDTETWTISAQYHRSLSVLMLTEVDNLEPNIPEQVRDIWFDDDGSDWDGYVALYTLCVWHNRGYCNLIGVSQTSNELYACGASRAILNYLGLSSIPVTHYKGDTTGLPVEGVNYANATTSTYLPAEWAGKQNSDYPSFVSTFTSVIANSEDNSVCVIANGQGRGIKDARAANVSLWREKVMCVTVSSIRNDIVLNSSSTGGSVTDSSAESGDSTFNFNQDGPAWNSFIPQLATDGIPLVCTDVDVGYNVQTASSSLIPLTAAAPTQPLARIRQIANAYYSLPEGSSRYAWDTFATYVAVFGMTGTIAEPGGAWGTTTVNSANNTPVNGFPLGYNLFEPLTGGVDQYAIPARDYPNGAENWGAIQLFFNSFLNDTDQSVETPRYTAMTVTLPNLSFSSSTARNATVAITGNQSMINYGGDNNEVHLFDPAGIPFTSDLFNNGTISGDGTATIVFAAGSAVASIGDDKAKGWIAPSTFLNWFYKPINGVTTIPGLVFSATTLSMAGTPVGGTAMNMIANGYLWRKVTAAGNGTIDLILGAGTGGNASPFVNTTVYDASNNYEEIASATAGASLNFEVDAGVTYLILFHRTTSGTITSPNFSVAARFNAAPFDHQESPPNKGNYKLAGCRVYVRPVGEEQYICLGNIVSPNVNPLLETLDHFTSLSGTRRKDRVEITGESYDLDFVLDEFTTENLRIALRGDSLTNIEIENDNEVLVSFDCPGPGFSHKLGYKLISPDGPISGALGGTFHNGSESEDMIPYDPNTGIGDYFVDYELGVITFPENSRVQQGDSVDIDFDIHNPDADQYDGMRFNPGTLLGSQEIDGFIFSFLDNKGGVVVWEGVKGVIVPNGAINLSDTDWSNIPLRISVLENSETPDSPFGTIQQF